MEHNDLRTLSWVFHAIANTMTRYQGDLFLDFPTACLKYERGEKITLFVGESHSDLIDRYEGCLKEGGNTNPTYDECLEECKRTLGLDFSVEITQDQIIVTNYNLTHTRLNYLVESMKCGKYAIEGAIMVINEAIVKPSMA